MGTRWIPMTRMEPRRWLLGDGTIMTEPPLEMTATGRKVRVAGSASSVYASQVEGLLNEAAASAARQQGFDIWLPIPDGQVSKIPERLAKALAIPLDVSAELHFVHQAAQTNVSTIAYWRFKDPGSPFEAIMAVVLTTLHNNHTLRTVLAMPHTDQYGQFSTAAIQDAAFGAAVSTLGGHATGAPYDWQEFIRDNPTELPVSLGSRQVPNPRAGVTALREAVQKIEAVDTIQVPHLGKPGEPSWLELELYASNVGGQFLSDLAEYLDGSPTIDQAADLYQQLLDTLKTVGITLEGKEKNAFLAALLAGDKAQMNVGVAPLSDLTDNGVLGFDHDHTLDIHLPTGTFVINCSRGADDKRSAAVDHWEEAKVKASLTGQESELLAYARGFVESEHVSRSKKIMKARR